jgi:hypothetical protein
LRVWPILKPFGGISFGHMGKMKSGNESKPYRKFRQATERALEEIHRNAQIEINDIARNAFTQLVAQAVLTLKRLPYGVAMNKATQDTLTQTNAHMDALLVPLANEMAGAIKRLKRRAFILSYVASAEAAGRLTGKETQFSIAPGEIDEAISKNSDGVPLINRTMLALSRVKRKILDALEFSIVQELPEDEAIEKIMGALPKTRTVVRPKKAIQKLTEADFPFDEDSESEFTTAAIGTAEMPVALSSGFVSDQDWNDIVDAYKQAYVPKYRGPESVITDLEPKPDGSEWYGWEIEKETTHEFVKDVRDAAKRGESENGITDFVFVAIVDDKTDECCLWRDGLLTSEIEERLSDHEDDDEGCGDGIVPPIHFNCRCTLAPAVDDIPDVPDNKLAEFEEWLNV